MNERMIPGRSLPRNIQCRCLIPYVDPRGTTRDLPKCMGSGDKATESGGGLGPFHHIQYRISYSSGDFESTYGMGTSANPSRERSRLYAQRATTLPKRPVSKIKPQEARIIG